MCFKLKVAWLTSVEYLLRILGSNFSFDVERNQLIVDISSEITETNKDTKVPQCR